MKPFPFFLDTILQQTFDANVTKTINLNGLGVDLWLAEQGYASWLEMYLSPLAKAGSPNENKKNTWKAGNFFSPEVVSDTAIFLESGVMDWFEVWNGKCHIRRLFFSPQLVVDFDREYGTVCCYDLENKTVTLVTSAHTSDPVHELGRCIRDLLTAFMRSRGWELFHAGAVRVGGKICLLPGYSGAGKTSLVVAMLHAGGDYIANDRVFIKVTGDTVRLKAFPMAAAIGMGTAMQYPQLKHYIQNPWSLKYPRRRLTPEQVSVNPEQAWEKLPDKLQFFPQELIRLMGKGQIVEGGTIEAVVLPHISDYQGASVTPAEVEKVSSILENNVLDPSLDSSTAPWRPFDFPPVKAPSYQTSIEKLLTLPLVDFHFLASRNLLNDVRNYSRYLLSTIESMSVAEVG